MKKYLRLIVVFSSLFAGAVYADCTFSGKTYSEGAIIPGYICSGGAWVPH